MSKRKPSDWPALENIARLPQAVMDNHTHLPISPTEGPGAAAASGPLSAAQLVERAQAVGVDRMITSACELPAFAPSLELARQLPGVKVALAIHPNEAVLHAGVSEVGPDGLQPRFEAHHGAYDLDAALAQVERACRENPETVVAVGETGMDLFRTGPRGGVAQRWVYRCRSMTARLTVSALRFCLPTAPLNARFSTALVGMRLWPRCALSTAGMPQCRGR